jgi:hypothetical protein
VRKAIIREKAFQDDRFESGIPNERSSRYREGVREAVAVCLTRFSQTVTKLAASPIAHLQGQHRQLSRPKTTHRVPRPASVSQFH